MGEKKKNGKGETVCVSGTTFQQSDLGDQGMRVEGRLEIIYKKMTGPFF
jgi:hypothetical protein